jgi:hypothetical protein
MARIIYVIDQGRQAIERSSPGIGRHPSTRSSY